MCVCVKLGVMDRVRVRDRVRDRVRVRIRVSTLVGPATHTCRTYHTHL